MKQKIIHLLIMVATSVSMFAIHANPAIGQRNQIRTDSRILYHDGPIMPGTTAVYLIYYGNWTGSSAPNIVDEFMSVIATSPYFRINTTYPGANGVRPSGTVFYAGKVDDLYSHGVSLAKHELDGIVVDKITSGELPLDSNGIYLIMGSPDVTDVRADGSFYCTPGTSPYHTTTVLDGTTLKYGFVGSPVRCPSSAAPQFVAADGTVLPTPNGNFAADGMINTVARLLNVIITSPLGTTSAAGGWYDRYGLENSDKCVGKFGVTYTTASGARANITTAGRDYLIQQNWVNDRKGFCALSYQ